MTRTREELVARAQLCEQIGLYDEMVTIMNALIDGTDGTDKLVHEERNFLSIAYKNYIGPRRSSWRVLHSVEKTEEFEDKRKYEIARCYRKKVQKELQDKCTNLVTMLETKLIPGIKEPESDIFYHKMKGDYNRYLAETEVDDIEQANVYIDKANESYEGASTYASTSLAATHPLRLGLALNYSVFIHELMQKPELANELARTAYEEALGEIEGVKEIDEGRYSESTSLMKLIRENLKIWSAHSTQLTPSRRADQF